MSSLYAGNIRISIFGQSHSRAIGVVIDGLPAGHPLDLDALQAFMARRSPAQNPLGTPRKETDAFEILSGVVNGRLCGASLALEIRNKYAHSADYAPLEHRPRPGHADYTARLRYGGYEDKSGGGHFSGRLTAPLCAAGGIILQLLREQGVEIAAQALEIGGIRGRAFDPMAPEIRQIPAGPLPALEKGEAMAEAIQAARDQGDSLGGVIECAAVGFPAGIGDPMFDGLENRIARCVFAVPAVKGLEFGAGFDVARLRGSENNDPFCWENGRVSARSNHAGGILGGISTGLPILFRAAIKPTPSIALPQNTVDLQTGENVEIRIGGRHDPCIVPRAVPCLEAAAAIALYDAYLERNREA